MAKTLSKKFSIDLTASVAGSIAAAKSARAAVQSQNEAKFQQAIANGLSYDEQIMMREKMLEEEKKSSLSDAEYVVALEKSISDTKKLNRFNKYRAHYASTVGELSAGKINEEQYLVALKNQLSGVADPELRLEIQNDIAEAEGKVKTYRDTILDNQVKKAKYDGTKNTLSDAITRVNTARFQAQISNNEDAVTAYDETLSALNSQLSSVRIQDSIVDFQVSSSTRGTNPLEKLNFINAEIQKADPDTAIRVGDRSYASAQQFWSLERDNFLSGNSQVFGNFFEELNTHVDNTVKTASAKFGYPTKTVLDDAFQTFSDRRAKPELTPFLNRLDSAQASVMSEGADKYANQLIVASQGTADFSFKQADAEIQKISSRYGIDLTARRVQLQNLSLSDANVPERAVPELDLKLPVLGKEEPIVPSAKPVEPAVPVAKAPSVAPAVPAEKAATKEPAIPAPIMQPPQFTPTTGVGTKSDDGKFVFTQKGWEQAQPTAPAEQKPTAISPTTYQIKQGDTLSGIAQKLLGDASRSKEIAELNAITDPNKILSGATLKLPM